MKLCQTCHTLAADENGYCPHDGQLLIVDPLATLLQTSLGVKYTLTKLIGTGSMGAVYRAQHQSLDEVAIKVMLGPPDNQKLSERFLREAKALRKLRHQHSVLIYDLERSSTGLTYMVMEMVEGRSLRAELKERGQLPLEETLEIVEAVCGALQAAHERGIIHRDLKPDNILLAEEKTADGDVSQIIKIADFGIVKLRGTQQGGEDASMQLTKHGAPIGTPFYMSPEQWFGDGPGFTALDGRTDIYALACTVYEMLTGRPPFLGHSTEELRRKHLNDSPQSVTELAPHIPEAVSTVIVRSLEKDRDLRPASAEEFSNELHSAYSENRKDANQDQGAVRSVGAKNSTAAQDSISAEKYAEFQSTEESVPMIREWASEEAQQAIERVRQRQISKAPPVTPVHTTEESPTVPQPAEPPPAVVEAPRKTLVSDSPGVETAPGGRGAGPAAIVDPEFQQTLVLDKTRKRAPAGETTPESEVDGRELMVAQVGAIRIGVLMNETEAVTEWRTPIPLPHAPPAVLGIVSVRGRMLTVLDPVALLGLEHPQDNNSSPAFIIALRSDEQLALAVHSVEAAVKIRDVTAPDSNGSPIRCVVQSEHGSITVLDTRSLFDAATQTVERRRQRR